MPFAVFRCSPWLMLLLLVGAWSTQDARGQTAPETSRVPPDGPRVVHAIPGSTETLDLEDCVARALESNATLQAVRREMGELRGQMRQATSTGLPRLDLVGNWSRSRDPSFALDETFGSAGGDGGSPFDTLFAGFIPAPGEIPAQSFWRASADASWDINPTLVWNVVGGARTALERQEALISEAEQVTTEQTVIAFHDVFRASERVAAAQVEVAARQEFFDIARRRQQLDLATGLDTLRAAVSLANVRPEERRASQELRNAGSRLNVLMGRAALEPLAVREWEEDDESVIDETMATELAIRRPGIRSIELLEQMQRKHRGARRSEHRPYLSLFGSYGYVAREFSDLGDTDLDTWRASVSLTVPVFDGFLTRGRVAETTATIQRIRLLREEAMRQARLEVLTLLGELTVARENLDAALLNLSSSEDALRTTTLLYENGRADYLAVLNAESDRQTARSLLIQARFDVLSLTASLKRAMGISPLTPLDQIDADMLEISR